MRSREAGPGTARRPDERGFSLIEVMVAAFLLIIVFFGLTQFYIQGRRQVDYEEDRRKATAVLQNRLDGIRRDFTFETLAGLDGTSSDFTVDGRNYSIAHEVMLDDTLQMDTLRLTVTWQARTLGGTTVTRSMNTSTLLARGLP